MTYKFTRLISRVRVSLDQNHHEVAVLVNDENTLELDDIIRQKLLMSARWLLEHAPLERIDLVKTLVAQNTPTNEDGSYHVAVPTDYLRLHHVKVSGWDIPVTIAIPADSEMAMTVKSSFAGIRPNNRRPLVVRDSDTIDFYGGKGTVTSAKYIPLPKVEDNEMEYPELLHDALIQLCCAMVLETYKEMNYSPVYRQMAMASAGIQTEEKKK